MGNNGDIEAARQNAYKFIKHLFSKITWLNGDLNVDENLANALDIEKGTLSLLKTGEIDPPPKLVSTITEFFKHDPDPLLSTQIHQALVEPFASVTADVVKEIK